MNADDIYLRAELSKINFVLEHMLAIMAKQAGVTHREFPAFADWMLRQAQMPPSVHGPVTSDADLQAVQDLLEHRLAQLLARVQGRLEQDQGS